MWLVLIWLYFVARNNFAVTIQYIPPPNILQSVPLNGSQTIWAMLCTAYGDVHKEMEMLQRFGYQPHTVHAPQLPSKTGSCSLLPCAYAELGPICSPGQCVPLPQYQASLLASQGWGCCRAGTQGPAHPGDRAEVEPRGHPLNSFMKNTILN